MQWNEGKGVLLMHEVLGKSVLVHKPGSLECGQGWQNVADNLNSLDEFRVNGRGIRDCIMNLIKRYRVKINKEKMKPESKFEGLLYTLQKKEAENEKAKEKKANE